MAFLMQKQIEILCLKTALVYSLISERVQLSLFLNQ